MISSVPSGHLTHIGRNLSFVSDEMHNNRRRKSKPSPFPDENATVGTYCPHPKREPPGVPNEPGTAATTRRQKRPHNKTPGKA